jgi:hypothetical protein
MITFALTRPNGPPKTYEIAVIVTKWILNDFAGLFDAHQPE